MWKWNRRIATSRDMLLEHLFKKLEYRINVRKRRGIPDMERRVYHQALFFVIISKV
jgi:hypothetical protein